MARPKDVQDYVDKIEEMLLDERYEFAEDFLSSVLSFAKETDYISDAQKQGVDNIKNSVTW